MLTAQCRDVPKVRPFILEYMKQSEPNFRFTEGLAHFFYMIASLIRCVVQKVNIKRKRKI